ncbi:MAG TPA: GGDEF domain-containing protein [Vicinamibacteria bacterium]|nr:GGDEF domain-containing protein [Vicinamibacteria bacterium]
MTTPSLVPFLLGLLAAAGLLVPLVLRFRSTAAEARARALALEDEMDGLRVEQARVEEDQSSLSQFLKEFPHLARDLFSGLAERQIPASILNVVQKSLDPAHAVVLVRRGPDAGEGTFVVAVAAPEAGGPTVGTEVPGDRGEIGLVAEAQLVLSREDFASPELRERVKPGPDPLAGMRPEIYAPLVFDQETLGVIALSGPRHRVADGKAALRLISQTGAQALHAAAAYSRIRTTAEVDGLTRVFNKRHMEHVLSELVYRTACAGYDQRGAGTAGATTLSVFLFDIDHFKHYNDTNGHLPGDKLLQELARLVQESVRKDDILGRFGGEEFLLIMPNTTLAQGLAAANKVREVIARRKFPFAERQPMGMLTISGGVAEYPHDGMDASSLLRAADTALYEGKRLGRNRVLAASRPAPAALDPTAAAATPPGASRTAPAALAASVPDEFHPPVAAAGSQGRRA